MEPVFADKKNGTSFGAYIEESHVNLRTYS